MNEETYIRAACVRSIVSSYPAILRDELLSDPKFVDRTLIETDAIITLGVDGLSFKRSELFPAVVQAFGKTSTPIVKTVTGEEWTVKFAENSNPANVALERDGARLIVSQLALLNPDQDARLRAFQAIVEEHHFDGDVGERWRTLLTDRAPDDHEITRLQSDLQATAAGEAGVIRESIQNGGITLDVLVPRSEAYYRNLVGAPGDSNTLEGFVTEALAPFISQLLEDRQRRSLSLVWLLCAQPRISHLIEGAWSGDDQALADAFNWLGKHGDPVSQVGAIELGMRRVGASPTLTEPLRDLVATFLAEPVAGSTNPFALLSALFESIYGHMARCRILADWHPVARRMAALAHSGFIMRQLAGKIRNITQFVGWLRVVPESYFILQCLVDMRTEPRWFPELSSADQWKNELFGRVLVAAASTSENAEALGLKERLLGNGSDGIRSRISGAEAELPGPLEGGVSPAGDLSPENIAVVRSRLEHRPIETTSFSPLINASMWMRIPEELVDLASEAIEEGHYQIAPREEVPLLACLLGLASLSAVTRNRRLCEVILTTLRVSRRLNHGELSVDDAFRIGVLASAAHAEKAAWVARLGEFMTELSLQDMSADDAGYLRSHLNVLCHLTPELWGTCGQADAALALAS